MRNGKQPPVADPAPAADIFSPQLDEVDGPVVLVVPTSRHDFSLIVIDLNNRTWAQDGEHRKVRNANQPVNAFSILLPGGGYFYTGHPLVAIVPAVVEALLVLEILLVSFALD
jgi:hypothetical protein